MTNQTWLVVNTEELLNHKLDLPDLPELSLDTRNTVIETSGRDMDKLQAALEKLSIESLSFNAPGQIESAKIVRFEGELIESTKLKRLPLEADEVIELEPIFVIDHGDTGLTADYVVSGSNPTNIHRVVISYWRTDDRIIRTGHIEYDDRIELLGSLTTPLKRQTDAYIANSFPTPGPLECVGCQAPLVADPPRRAAIFEQTTPLPKVIRVQVEMTGQIILDTGATKAYARYFIDSSNISFKRIEQNTQLELVDSDQDLTIALGPDFECKPDYDNNFASATFDKARENLTFVHEIGHLVGATHSAQRKNAMSENASNRQLFWDDGARRSFKHGLQTPV